MAQNSRISRFLDNFFYFIKLAIYVILCCSSGLKEAVAAEVNHSQETSSKKHIILTIDGGGVRGIIPARILQEIEERIKHPIYAVIDTISGNSTGGIIAIGLVTPDESGIRVKYAAKDLVALYKDRSKEIFSRSLWHRIKTGGGLWGTKYDRQSLDQILVAEFGTNTLSKVLKNALVFSYSLDKREGHLWSSEISKNNNKKDFYLKDIAAATSAAPTYFAPARISNINGDYCYTLKSDNEEEVVMPVCTEADGGIFANNPAIMTVAFTLKHHPHLNKDDFILISLGTGQIKKIDQMKLHQGGVINWLLDANVIDLILNATAEISEWTAIALGIETHRIQVFIDPKNEKLDNSAPENIQMLIDKAEDYIKNNHEQINKICAVLLQNKK